jgi:hypothetical protein
MKLTEYFLKVCESCLPESEGKLKTDLYNYALKLILFLVIPRKKL